MELLRFVVGIDGSEPSDAALAWALATAAIGGEELLLVHVIDHPEASEDLGVCSRDDLESAEACLARALDRVPEPQRSRVRTRIVAGPTARTIADVTSDRDVLVIGTHKTGFLHGRVLGSRGLVVASLVRSRLVVVPPVRLEGRRGVVAGIVAGQEWAETVRVAAVHASRFGGELRLVHARAGHEVREPADGAGDSGRVVLAAAEHAAVSDFPGLQVDTRLSRRDAVTAFLDAGRTAVALVIPLPQAEWAGRFTGSIAHDVLLNINAPVILVPTARMPVAGGALHDLENSAR